MIPHVEPNYTIRKQGTSIIAIDENGIVVLSSSSAKTVIQSVIRSNTSVLISADAFYIENNGLSIRGISNFGIYGYGNSSYLYCNNEDLAGKAIFSISDSKNITISGLGLAGSQNCTLPGDGQVGTLNSGIIAANVTNIKVQYCTLQYFGYDGMNFLCECRNGRILNNTVSWCGDDGINPGGGIFSVYEFGTSNFVVTGNYIANVDDDGIHISKDSTNTIVTSNTIVNCSNGIGFYSTNHNWIYENGVSSCTYGFKEHNGFCDYNFIFSNVFTGCQNKYLLIGANSEQYDNIFL